ncbi:MAG: ParB/RepB/Spo0J family partition protein [Erysipelotrichaceae bacterium]
MRNIMDTYRPMSPIEMIHYMQIVPNEKNFYEIVDVKTLAEDILENGLSHNIEVMRFDNSYKLISGERRYRALSLLIDEGHKQFEMIPCRVLDKMDDLKEEERIIATNSYSRVISNADRMIAIERLNFIYNERKKKGEVDGRVRDLIAKEMNISSSQVGTYQKIIKNAIPELKEEIAKGNITIANASTISSYNEEEQLKMIYDSEGNIDIKIEKEDEYKEDELSVTGECPIKKETIDQLLVSMNGYIEKLSDKFTGCEWKEQKRKLADVQNAFNQLLESLDCEINDNVFTLLK